MENDKQDSIWENLADELGVEADAEAAERKQPEPVDLPSASKQDQSGETPEQPESSPSDWNALAESLGLEVPPQEEPEPEPVAAASEPDPESFTVTSAADDTEVDEDEEDEADFAEGIGFEELPELTSEENLLEDDFSAVEEDAETDDVEQADSGMSGEAARDAFEALFAEGASDWELPQADPSIFDTPLEFKAEVEEDDSSDVEEKSEADEAEALSTDEDEEAAERPKRRRRRRRGRRGRGEGKSETGEEQETDDSEDAVSEATSEEDTDDEDSERERPKRRRRRRGRRGSRAERSESDDQTAEGESDDFEDDDVEDQLLASENGSKGTRRRAAHRNLPTWTEAIGCIVDANIEQRSKAPAKQSSRGRGRGRGRRKN